jgi:hypothetical protein
MKAQRTRLARLAAVILLAPAAAALSGCEGSTDPGPSQGSTTPEYERAQNAAGLARSEQKVRVGELGPNFPACYAMARFRDRVVEEGQPVPVRAAPSDQAEESGRIAADGQFFICTRSHDQRWFAVVWHDIDGASRSCGVSTPLPARRDYQGPCESGWIPSALVRLESGIRHAEPTLGNISS